LKNPSKYQNIFIIYKGMSFLDLTLPIIRPYCEDCRHYNAETARCAAFGYRPIPNEIYFGLEKHDRPVKGQWDKIVFEPKE
jgi:hypothetical protein